MTDTRKVNITLPGGASINAEGTEEYVNSLLDRFAEMLKQQPAPTTTVPAKSSEPALGHTAQGDGLPYDRLFTQEDFYGVALMGKPKTDDPDADGLLALLYGFAVLKKETTVTAIRLQRAAEKSGLDTPRLGRTISKHTAFVTDSGKGKGKRYGLNNPGMAKAVEILRGIIG